MKNLVGKITMATCISSVAILSTAKATVAQVNMDFLTEVVESCQKDVFSEKYYQQMGLKVMERFENDSSSYLKNCIQSRYFYLQLISKLPWLVSTEEIIPGYPGSVVASRIAHNKQRLYNSSDNSMLDCLASGNKDSQECSNSVFGQESLYNLIASNRSVRKFSFDNYHFAVSQRGARLGYLCPSCFVAYNNNPSKTKMIGAFIEWFTKLEKSQRKELISILGDEQAQEKNRNSMIEEADKAWSEYAAIRKRMAEEEKERRRRELLGE